MSDNGHARPVVITGGAGFIGANLAHRLLEMGTKVVLFDNLSRASVTRNVQWLREQHGPAVDLRIGDVRDIAAVASAVQGAAHVYHFAAQVAVTTSLERPVEDFDVNARGTLNVLEAIRRLPEPPSLLFTSTNKVYGALDDVRLVRRNGRYAPEDAEIAAGGIGEDRPLDFHSPYGCSKGAADQMVIDFARSYGLRTAVFRMSCIYGPHQFGSEDQGWLAHFLIRAVNGDPITIYGDGMQVRDVLFVGDLVDAMLVARARIDRIAGHAFNIGGGVSNTTSLLELIELIEEIRGERPDLSFERWRTGDQRWYVSNAAKFTEMTGWQPRVPLRDGLRRLSTWLGESRVRGGASAGVLEASP